ncbi:MFS general substrate transporter [Testicularia cyperi]|uniref:MFS-type efflux pump MMF1 n=1 Tax=Testicularia cyperi TaxID=1882483 RepID=A0A317XSM2_9BASI|nr:MFS general substrate transporter [Testicularia cyperi]
MTSSSPLTSSKPSQRDVAEAELTVAALEGPQIAALDTATAETMHGESQRETPLPSRTYTSDGSNVSEIDDEKEQGSFNAVTPTITSTPQDQKPTPAAGAAISETHTGSDTPSKGQKHGNGHWLQQNEITLPENKMVPVMIGLNLCIFLAALDQTIVSTALPVISEHLDGDAGQYSWVGAAYLLAATSLVPLYGRLSDLTGRKPLLFASIIIFLIGSALCGAAQSMAWLDGARAIQGIGGGGIIALVNIVIGDIVSLEKRGKYSGWVGGVWGVASVVGPLLGGAFTDAGKNGWRWCFFVNLPTGAIALAILFFFLNLNPRPKLTFREACGEFDFIGLVMVVVAVILILLGFNSAETKAWNRPDTIAFLAVGGVLFVLFMVWEFHTTKKPIIPPRLFKTRTTALLLVSVTLHALPFFAATFYLPVYFQTVFGASALMSGVYMLPYALIGSIMSSITGIGITKFRTYRPFLWIGWIFMVIGHALMATLDADSNLVKQEFYIGIAGFGTGFLFQTPMVGLMAAMPHDDLSTTVAAMTLLRSMGGTMGIAIAGAIFNSESRKRLNRIPGYSPSIVQTGKGGQDLTGLKNIQPPELSRQIIVAYADGLKVLWTALAPLVGVGLISVLFVKGYSLRRNIKKAPKADSANSDVEDQTSSFPSSPTGAVTPITATTDEKQSQAQPRQSESKP